MTEPDRWRRAGVAGRAHGLDGSFHVSRPEPDLLQAGALVRIAGRELPVVRRAGFDARPILRLEGCDDRRSAEALGGHELFVYVERELELGPDEWWAEDLEGCAVRDAQRDVGVVARLLALPSCEVLEVTRGPGEPALLVPLVKDAVRGVDVEARVIDVDLRFLGED